MSITFARQFACAIAIVMSTAAASFAVSADTQPITNGAEVIIKVTIEVPEERMIIPDRIGEYVHGRQQVLPALEAALNGKQVGDQAHLDLQAEQAFGAYDPSKRMSVARSQVPLNATVGDLVETSEGVPFIVVELSDAWAVIDFNHPLAGKRVVLDVTVMQVSRGPSDHGDSPGEPRVPQSQDGEWA